LKCGFRKTQGTWVQSWLYRWQLLVESMEYDLCRLFKKYKL